MKKKLLTLSTVLLLMFSVGTTALATTAPPQEPTAQIALPRADEIIAYYRINDEGLLQRRQWNATRNYWVDEWTNVGTPAPATMENWIKTEIDGVEVFTGY